MVPAAEIRALREENPSNLATLCFKAVGKLEHAAQNGAQTQKEQEVVEDFSNLTKKLSVMLFIPSLLLFIPSLMFSSILAHRLC